MNWVRANLKVDDSVLAKIPLGKKLVVPTRASRRPIRNTTGPKSVIAGFSRESRRAHRLLRPCVGRLMGGEFVTRSNREHSCAGCREAKLPHLIHLRRPDRCVILIHEGAVLLDEHIVLTREPVTFGAIHRAHLGGTLL